MIIFSYAYFTTYHIHKITHKIKYEKSPFTGCPLSKSPDPQIPPYANPPNKTHHYSNPPSTSPCLHTSNSQFDRSQLELAYVNYFILLFLLVSTTVVRVTRIIIRIRCIVRIRSFIIRIPGILGKWGHVSRISARGESLWRVCFLGWRICWLLLIGWWFWSTAHCCCWSAGTYSHYCWYWHKADHFDQESYYSADDFPPSCNFS